MITINSGLIKLNKINKSYLKLTKEDKEYIVHVYYKYKHLKSLEIQKLLGISQKTYAKVFKEFGINSKLKNRYTLNEDYFESVDTSEKAYILGLIYADGFVGDKNNFALSMKDKQIVEDVAKAIEYTGDIRETGKGGFENSKICYRINFSNRKFVSNLNKHGVFTRKSLVLNELPDLRKDLYKDFLN